MRLTSTRLATSRPANTTPYQPAFRAWSSGAGRSVTVAASSVVGGPVRCRVGTRIVASGDRPRPVRGHEAGAEPRRSSRGWAFLHLPPGQDNEPGAPEIALCRSESPRSAGTPQRLAAAPPDAGRGREPPRRPAGRPTRPAPPAGPPSAGPGAGTPGAGTAAG